MLFIYFPSLSISLIKDRDLLGCINVKELLIRVNERANQKREHRLVFLTYTKWPTDENVSGDPETFLSFIHLAHSYQIGDNPLLIHCNTGVGRTGCSLLVSLTLIKIIRGRSLDIFAMAKECRRQRSGLVQTEQQYRFVYDCIRYALNMAIEHSILQSAQ